MSASDKRRNLRTQGKFAPVPSCSCENNQKESTGERNKLTKRKNAEGWSEKTNQSSSEIKEESTGTSGEEFSNSPQGMPKVTYQENSHYDVRMPFEPHKQPEEMKEAGMRILSTTHSGDSKVFYYPRFLDIQEAFQFYDTFSSKIKWIQPHILIRGKEYLQPRMVAWFGPFPYAYSGVVLHEQEMTEDILLIKEKMENFLAERGIKVTFNSVLLNQYRHGHHSVAWHSDDELSMGIDPTIASISLGETRKFEMRRKPTKDNSDPPTEHFVNLRNGSLVVMDGVMQVDWQHRVPKEPGRDAPRINLTFRTVYKDERLIKAIK